MKLGALGLPSYRTFSLDELEEATNNFDTSTFMGESHGQVYIYKCQTFMFKQHIVLMSFLLMLLNVVWSDEFSKTL